jgi:hypothetical protein
VQQRERNAHQRALDQRQQGNTIPLGARVADLETGVVPHFWRARIVSAVYA